MWYYSLSEMNKAKEVVIGFHKNTPFKVEQTILDDHGRFLFLWGTMGDMQLTLANIYLLNIKQSNFFIRTLSKLKNFAKGAIILAGDINMSLDPLMNTSRGHSYVSCKCLSQVKNNLYK